METEKTIVNERVETTLKTSDFWYDLPEELIAQTPVEPRDESRLLILDRESGEMRHRVFRDILEELRPEDMLVVNSSKVIPARLLGVSRKTGSPEELLLLKQLPDGTWETLVRPGKRARVGAVFTFGDCLTAEVTEVKDDGNRIVAFSYDKDKYHHIYEVLNEVGNMPLPPYIHEKLADRDRYQTVYAKEEGSAAAPTAGLHFTPELLDAIRAKGVGYGEVTLHVGLGTFRPVKAERIEDHLMHAEHFSITPEVCDEINRRRAAGGRIVAVGTTTCRVLETVADDAGIVHPMTASTQIFIYPGYRFKAIDALITNFHLPESTLLMLVSALAGREHILRAYEEAVRLRYRFFSFGDAMLIRGRARRETVSTDARTDDRTDATAHGGDTETANANAGSADDTGPSRTMTPSAAPQKRFCGSITPRSRSSPNEIPHKGAGAVPPSSARGAYRRQYRRPRHGTARIGARERRRRIRRHRVLPDGRGEKRPARVLPRRRSRLRRRQ